MFFKEVPITVYRLTPAADNFSDPTYTQVGIVYGSVQPFTGDEAIHAAQNMENVRDLLVFSDPEVDLMKSDELTYQSGTARIAYIQRFRSGVLDHAEVLTTDSQWNR